MSFFSGSPAEYEQVSNLTRSQLKNQKDLERSSRGAFTDVGNYYRSNLSNNPQDFQAFAAPDIRRFNEQTIPNLAEQFAGMGAGGLSSSGFQNAAIGAGTDLQERLANLRASIRQNAASGMQNMAQSSLNPHTQYQMTNPGSEGFLSSFASGLGGAIPGAAMGFLTGGPPGAVAGAATGASQGFGQSSPYGKQGIPSPSPSGYKGSFGAVPNFAQGYV
jgi:hypothetical protein